MIIYSTVIIIVYCYDYLILVYHYYMIIKCTSYDGYRYDSVLEIDQLKFFFGMILTRGFWGVEHERSDRSGSWCHQGQDLEKAA